MGTSKAPAAVGPVVASGDDKSSTWAHLWWILGVGGILGLHRFYLGDRRQGLIELATLGGLGVLATRDLIAMDGLVDEANGVQRAVRPTFWARPGWRGRWLPIMWRGRLVFLAALASLALAAVAWQLSLALSVLVTWALGVWTFAIGLRLGGWLLPAFAPLLLTWHYRLSGRAPGEPLAGIEEHPRETIRVDPVPDEAFLPLAAALSVAFQLVDLGPAVPIVGRAYALAFPLVPLAAGLVLPWLRAPVGMALRSVRYNDRGELSSSRPLGQQLSAYFGLALVIGALVQAALARQLQVFTLAFTVAVPILVVQAWYTDDRLSRDVARIEDAVRARIELPVEAPKTP